MRKEGEFVTRARILLADDHEGMRCRIQRHLEPEFEVLDTFLNGLALLEAASRLKPDICVLDISMPVLNGLETATRLKECGSTAKIVFLAIVDDPDYVKAALQLGASGYVVKERMLSDLRPAIKETLAGRIFVSPSIDLGGVRSESADPLAMS
jgi:DNA-binding NarL/FixJ family response regulator